MGSASRFACLMESPNADAASRAVIADYYACMSVAITVHDVPDEVHNELSAPEGKIDVRRESAEPHVRGEEHPSLVATWDTEADDVYDLRLPAVTTATSPGVS